MSIELENIEGIGAKTAEQLKEEGIMNAMILASTTVKKLKSIGIGDSTARKYIEKAREVMDKTMGGSFGFVMGEDLLKQFNNRIFLKTGQPVLDTLLGGGFETQKVYELYGPEGSGKSSLLHQIMCISKLPVSKGGLASPATVFLDCEGSMSINRIQIMAPFWGVTPEEVIKSTARTEPPTSDSLVFMCEANLPKIMDQTGAKLIFLDSIATHFRSEYGDSRQLFPERQQKANRVLHALKRMAVNYNALVIITNQVTGNVDAQNKYSKKYSHSMGYTIGHESQVRILIEPVGEFRRIKVEKAVDLPNDYCHLIMTEFGLLDPEIIKDKGIKKPDKKGNEVKIIPKTKTESSKKSEQQENLYDIMEENESEEEIDELEENDSQEVSINDTEENEISEFSSIEAPYNVENEDLKPSKKSSTKKSKKGKK